MSHELKNRLAKHNLSENPLEALADLADRVSKLEGKGGTKKASTKKASAKG